MALYEITLRDGSTLQVEAPENASQEELLRRANRQRRCRVCRSAVRVAKRNAKRGLPNLDAMRPPPPEEETGFFGDLTGGFASGVVGVGETAALGAATLLDEEQELAARSRIQSAASALRPSFGDEEDLTFKIAARSVPSLAFSAQVLLSLLAQARRVLAQPVRVSRVF
jgi:hypothetical protein